MRSKIHSPFWLIRCRFLLAASPFCIYRWFSFLCGADILFSFGLKEISRAGLRAASQIALITLSELFAIILERICGCLQVSRYLMLLLSLGFLFLGAISLPFYCETGKENSNFFPCGIYCSRLCIGLAFRGYDLPGDMSVGLVLRVRRLLFRNLNFKGKSGLWNNGFVFYHVGFYTERVNVDWG